MIGFIDRLIPAPDLHQLSLLGPLLVVVQALVYAFAGAALVSTLLSLAHRQTALGRAFADVLPRQPALWVAAGFLPLLTLPVLLGQLLFGSRFHILDQFVLILPLGLIGLGALYTYRIRLSIISGGLGVLATLAFVPPFVNLLELINHPSLWPLLPPLVPDPYEARRGVALIPFAASALLGTGAALLVRHFAWPETKRAAAAPALRRWATTLAIAGAILLPVGAVAEYAVLPVSAQSAAAAKAAWPVIGFAWLAAMCWRRIVWLSVFAALAIGAEACRQHAVRMTAVGDRVALITLEAEQRFAALTQQQQARYTAAQPIDPQAAAKLYQERCATCHAFDRVVVGPAHRNVVPKYAGDAPRLAAFIQNPTKVDPAFPPMPAPGLSRREAKAIAEYLIQQVSGADTTPKPAAATGGAQP